VPELYYKPSGKFSPPGLLLGLIGGTAGGAAFGAAYTRLVYYLPNVYINVFGTVALGAGLGFVVGWLLAVGKVRSPLLGRITFLVSAAAAIYLSWVVWVYLLLTQAGIKFGGFAVLLEPRNLWPVIVELNASGVWTFKGSMPKGWLLWTIWVGEAAIILVVGMLVVNWKLKLTAFCERCVAWCTSPGEPWRFAYAAQPDDLRQALELKDYSKVSALVGAADDSGAWSEFALQSCPQCRETNALTVENVTVTTNAKGKAEQKRARIVHHLLLGSSEVDELRRVTNRPPPTLDVKS